MSFIKFKIKILLWYLISLSTIFVLWLLLMKICNYITQHWSLKTSLMAFWKSHNSSLTSLLHLYPQASSLHTNQSHKKTRWRGQLPRAATCKRYWSAYAIWKSKEQLNCLQAVKLFFSFSGRDELLGFSLKIFFFYTFSVLSCLMTAPKVYKTWFINVAL